MTEYVPIHFFAERIEVVFDVPPLREKTPTCPNAFLWNGEKYGILESIAEWSDFTRRGRMSKNMRPAHAEAASTRGSLNVGRFYFRVKTDSGRIFDIYYDRAVKSVNDRKGEWFLYCELA
jgi:hypothetical protein